MTGSTDTMSAFARDHVAPRALYRVPDMPRDLWRDAGRAGLFAIGLPEGGYAAIADAYAALAEHGGTPGFAGAWAGHQLVARFIVQDFADPTQRAAWLPGLAAGTLTACVAISEPGVGAHPKLLTTTATRADATVRLDGRKSYVSNATLADLIIIVAISRVEGDRKRYSAYVVPVDTPGLTLIEGSDLGALRPSRHAGLVLECCTVPAANRLGPPDTAFETMAIPFRDVEDAVGTAGMAGTFRHLLHRLAAITDPRHRPQAALVLGGLAASVAVVSETAAALASTLDAGGWRPGSPPGAPQGAPQGAPRGAPRGAPPATLTGIRLLSDDILAGMRRYRADFAPGRDDAIDILLGDVALLLGVAKGPRTIKQSRIGMTLLRHVPAAEERGA